MGGLVDPERTAVLYVPMPSAEVTRAVVDVEVPVEIDAGDFADPLVVQELFYGGVVGAVAVVEGYEDFLAGTFLGIEDRLAFRRVGGHRLFGDDVGTGLHGLDYENIVGAVHRGYDDPLGLGGAHHLVEVSKGGAIGAHIVLYVGEPSGVFITESYERYLVGVVVDQVFAPQAGAPDAGADEGYAFLLAVFPAGEGFGLAGGEHGGE